MMLLRIIPILATIYFNLQCVTSQCMTDDDMLSLAPEGDLSMIVKFELELFKLLLPKDDHMNFIFSPYSVWNCLVLAYFGSGGEQERQIQRTINVDDKISTLRKWRKLQYMYAMRPATSINNTFVLANRAYFDQLVYVKPCMDNFLHSEIEILDFSKAYAAAAHINNFVSETTKGTIENLVTPDDVRQARMVIANAAYFKGTWKTQFDPQATLNLPFYCSDGTIKNVDLMMNNGEFRYGYDEYLETEVVELPYEGEILSMLILLPFDSTNDGFQRLLTRLTPRVFKRMRNNMKLAQMMVQIPRFTIDTLAGDELIQVLNLMGLTLPFDPDYANFTTYAPYDHLYLDRSIHKAYIAVNEEGTEASAASAFISNRLGGNTFRCDRPFMFAIRDNETKNIMFMGVYKGPPPPPPPPEQEQIFDIQQIPVPDYIVTSRMFDRMF